MRWRVELTAPAAKSLRRLDPPIAKQLAEALRELTTEFERNAEQARQGYIIRLQGRPGEYRRRVGKYRFEVESRATRDAQGQSTPEGFVVVTAIGRRDEIYKRI